MKVSAVDQTITQKDNASVMSHSKPLVLRGRTFDKSEIIAVQKIVQQKWALGRSAISRAVCESLGWRQRNGRLKDRACRDVLGRLQALDLIELPPSRSPKCAAKKRESCPRHPQGFSSIVQKRWPEITACDWHTTTIEMVRWQKRERLWNCLVDTYHYQAYSLIVGRYLKYLVHMNETPLACIGWGDPAWHLKDRDDWIGWSDETRRQNLERIVNNVRFLVLPWVVIPNFASALLSRAIKSVERDWEKFYGIRPVLLETFVDKSRFRGTCYKAANWICIGTTKGYARKGYSYHNHQNPKDIYLYPLRRNTVAILQE
jgi:hypothetical protein